MPLRHGVGRDFRSYQLRRSIDDRKPSTQGLAACASLSVLCVFYVGVIPVAAQTSVAGIIGQVKDESDAVMLGGTVVATSPAL
jgi:hypothetical protein